MCYVSSLLLILSTLEFKSSIADQSEYKKRQELGETKEKKEGLKFKSE